MLERNVFRTGDQTLVREINLSLILNQLREHAPVSRAALAEKTGLNKSTVSSLIHELINHHFVREVGLSATHIGRPSRLLELNPQAGFIISAEIGVDSILVLCADFTAQTIWRYWENTPADLSQDAIIERFLAFLHQGQQAGVGHGSLLGIAVGVPGLVDQRDGTVLFAPNLGWNNVPLGKILRQRFGSAPVFVDNEANMAALGEHFFGAAQGYHEVLYISAREGLGGAIVRDGHLFRGSAGFAGEFGHMTMNPNGDRCKCGNRGCWETLVSEAALFGYLRRAVDKGQHSSLQNRLNRLTVPLVVEAARAGDPLSQRALERVGQYLGIGIASLINALNPDLVMFGGTLGLAWDFLYPSLRRQVERRALRWNAQSTQIVPARHGLDACVTGGVAVVYQAILAQPVNMVRSTASMAV